MNDYWIRAQASQRHTDYLKEVEHAERVEEAKAAAAAHRPASGPRPGAMRDPLRHRWQIAWPHPSLPHLHPHGRGG